jgi:hypothetical protein
MGILFLCALVLGEGLLVDSLEMIDLFLPILATHRPDPFFQQLTGLVATDRLKTHLRGNTSGSFRAKGDSKKQSLSIQGGEKSLFVTQDAQAVEQTKRGVIEIGFLHWVGSLNRGEKFR